MNKKLFLTIGFATLLLFFLPISLKAEETELSPTPAEEIDPDSVKGVREEVEKRVREKIDEIITKQEKRGWIGEITETSAIGFKIQVGEETRTVTINDEAAVINENRQSISFEDLEAGDWVIAMGYTQIDGSLDARRVVITSEKEPIEKISVFGTITEKAGQDEILLVRNNEESYELIFDNDSVINLRQDDQTEEIEYDDLAVDQKLVAVISPTAGSTATYQVEKMLVLTPPEEVEEEAEAETADTATESAETEDTSAE